MQYITLKNKKTKNSSRNHVNRIVFQTIESVQHWFKVQLRCKMSLFFFFRFCVEQI